MAQITVEGPDGEPVVPRADADGHLLTAPAPGTGGDASETTLQEVEASTATLAGAVRAAPGTTLDVGVGVHILSAPTLTVQVTTGQTATATPEASASGIVTRLAGITSEAAGESGMALDVGAYQRGGSWAVSLDPGDPGKPQFVRGSDDGGSSERIATEASVAATFAAVDELEADADATRLATEAIENKTPLGPSTMAGSRPIVFATDHPPVPAELYVGGSPLNNANPVPVRGITPARTPTGTPTAATSGQIGADGPGVLLYMRMKIGSPGGSRYILLFDAASADTLTTAKLIPSMTFPLTVTTNRAEQRFGYPLSFVNGLRWAVSSTEDTYTADVDTAYVFAQWVQ